MDPQQMMGLLSHCMRETNSAFQNGDKSAAMIWATQCLRVMRGVNIKGSGNEDLFTDLLFKFGKLYGSTGSVRSAVSCFEAAAYLQAILKADQPTADTLFMIADNVYAMDIGIVAIPILRHAQNMYETIGLTPKVEETRSIIASIESKTLDTRWKAWTTTHMFAAAVEKEIDFTFSISPNGVMKWGSTPSQISRDLPIGIVDPWRIVPVQQRS